MLAIERILYAKGIEVGKELAIAIWMRNDINTRNRGFTWEAMDEWDRDGSGDFGGFIKTSILTRWVFYCLGN